MDIIMIWNDPSLKVARDAFTNMVFSTPFRVVCEELGLVSSSEMELIIETYWLPWQKNVYDWLKMFGVCPYMVRKLPGTKHRIPAVPPLGTGYISTGMDESREQFFEWRYYPTNELGMAQNPAAVARMGTNEPEPNVHWVISDHPPLCNGAYTSLVSTLLQDYQTCKQLRDSMELASYQGTHMPYIFEHHPPKSTAIDDNIIALDNYGERAAGAMMSQVEGLNARKARMKASEFLAAIQMAHAQNSRRSDSEYASSSDIYALNSNADRQSMNRNSAGIIEKSWPLRPDFHYVQPAKPVLFGKYFLLSFTCEGDLATCCQIEKIKPWFCF